MTGALRLATIGFAVHSRAGAGASGAPGGSMYEVRVSTTGLLVRQVRSK
jgi:hypothetical protein